MNYFGRPGVQFKTVGLQNAKSIHGRTSQEITRIVFSCVEEVTEITYDEIITRSRKKELVQARQLTQYFLKKYTSYSLEVIGQQTKRDHATVLNSFKVVEQDCSDRIYRLTFERLEELIKLSIKN